MRRKLKKPLLQDWARCSAEFFSFFFLSLLLQSMDTPESDRSKAHPGASKAPAADEELRKELQQRRAELIELRRRISALHQEKENVFKELKAQHGHSGERSRQIHSLIGERSSFTDQVKALKEERSQTHQQIKQLLEQRRSQRNAALGAAGAEKHERPGRLKQMIAYLERTLETEVMPYEKEKQLRKRVKELQASYAQAAAAEKSFREASAAASELLQSRKRADELHKQVQQAAGQSQERHEKINALYKEAKKLRSASAPLEEKGRKLKEELETLRKESDAVQKRVDELSGMIKSREEAEQQQRAQEISASIEEKLRQRKKLTMDDILAFQAGKG